MTTIALVVAMDRNRVIGKDNTLPWRLPADLKHFKRVTVGRPIIMGRRTHESIGRALPERVNIVVSRDRGYRPAEGCLVAHSLDQALAMAGDAEEVMVIGGSALFAEALPQADRIYLTLIDAELEGDTFFPDYDPTRWCETDRVDHAPDEKNPYAYSFITLERA